MSIAAPPQPSCSTTHFHYEKAFYNIIIKFGAGFWNSELVFIQRHPTTISSEISVQRGKNCLEFSIA